MGDPSGMVATCCVLFLLRFWLLPADRGHPQVPPLSPRTCGTTAYLPGCRISGVSIFRVCYLGSVRIGTGHFKNIIVNSEFKNFRILNTRYRISNKKNRNRNRKTPFQEIIFFLSNSLCCLSAPNWEKKTGSNFYVEFC